MPGGAGCSHPRSRGALCNSHLAVAMIAGEIGRLRMRVRMGRADHLTAKRARTLCSVAIDRGELIFGFIVKGILQALFDFAAAFGLVLEVPSRSAPNRFFGWERITIAQLLLDLVQIHQLVMRGYFKAHATRRVGDLGGEADDLEGMIHLIG